MTIWGWQIPWWTLARACPLLNELLPLGKRTISTYFKGQLISKGLFGVFNSSKKMNNKTKIVLWYLRCFCLFFGRIEDTKKSFWNNWPLGPCTYLPVFDSIVRFLLSDIYGPCVMSRIMDAKWSPFFIEIPNFWSWADNLGR